MLINRGIFLNTVNKGVNNGKSRERRLFMTRLTGVFLLFLAAAVVIFDIPCIYRQCFGIICPGCGMSRAIKMLLSGDIAAAFNYHPMVFSLPVLLLYIVMDCRVFKNKVIDHGILILIGAGFAANYIVKLFL